MPWRTSVNVNSNSLYGDIILAKRPLKNCLNIKYEREKEKTIYERPPITIQPYMVLL